MRSVVSIPYLEPRNKELKCQCQSRSSPLSSILEVQKVEEQQTLEKVKWKVTCREDGTALGPTGHFCTPKGLQCTLYLKLYTEKAARRMKSLRCILICFKHNITIPLL